jgi:mRNA interferase RelE/StbE
MMKKVVILAVAARALHKHRADSERILKKIEAYASDPGSQRNNVKALVGSTAKRLRVGDFRVIFEET